MQAMYTGRYPGRGIPRARASGIVDAVGYLSLDRVFTGIRILSDLDDHGGSLQPMDPPEAAGSMARFTPAVGDDVLVFFIAQLIW